MRWEAGHIRCDEGRGVGGKCRCSDMGAVLCNVRSLVSGCGHSNGG